jgi:hypothetical protein
MGGLPYWAAVGRLEGWEMDGERSARFEDDIGKKREWIRLLPANGGEAANGR